MPAAGRASAIWPIMTTLMFAEVLAAFESSMIFVALPTITREYGDPALTGWLVTAYMLVQAISAGLGGKLGDLYGRRRLLAIALVLTALGSAISAMSSGLGGVIAGRAIQGTSGALLPLCYGLVREHVPASRMALSLSLVTATVPIGAALGMMLSGFIVEHWHWSYMFHVTFLLPLIALVGQWLTVPRDTARPRSGRIDIVGGVLFAPGIALLLYAVSLGARLGWANLGVWALLSIGIAIVVCWTIYEARHPRPLINVRLLARPQIAMTNIMCFFLAVGSLQMAMVVLILVQQPVATGIGLGLAAASAAVFKLPSNIASAVAAPLSGMIAGRHGARFAALVGATLQIGGWLVITVSPSAFWFILVGSLAVGTGLSILLAAWPILLVEVAQPEETSEVTGLTVVVRSMGQAIGSQIVTFLLATSVISVVGGGHYPSADAFSLVLAFQLAMAIGCFGAAWFLPRSGAAASLDDVVSVVGARGPAHTLAKR